LAKRGFFLSGQPSDDYEAYDTLGFRYQYVKFQYGQPVEEKIWEENQLSVRYLFRWEDSIEFNTPDIAASSSFDGLAYDLGIIQNPYGEPYYGRPSLVDKTGIDYRITKYYPNDTVAREGQISKGKKTGHWKYYSYEGKLLYEVDYADTIIALNDSIRFKSKGILTYPDARGNASSRSWIIEKVEKYDCSHSDHNEERMLYTFWEADTSVHRMNGYVKNYYDNGSLMNEGRVVNGLPQGIWKLYDSDGNLNQVGVYVDGKRDGRWLKGDLGNVKNMSEICLNPNIENLEEIIAYQEKLLDISVIYYGLGKILRKEYYGINMNNGDAPEGFGEEEYYGE
jgi:antitoxin component YwqK of YwqJK toxin-antitoxin module